MLIMVDMDGVIADFDAAFAKKARENGWTYTPSREWQMTTRLTRPGFYTEKDKRRDVNKIVEAKDFWATIPEIDGAVEAVKEISRKNEVYIVTTPWWTAPYCIAEKMQWLTVHLDWQARKTIFIQNKYLLRGDLLIDDKPEHITNWKGAFAVVYAKPWNIQLDDNENEGTKWIRLENWHQILHWMQHDTGVAGR